MAQHAMPFLIVNYGAEMVFILDQRLQAQNVNPEKSSKVLQDVIRAMFAPTFVEELLRPQPLYGPAATKEIFDRLAHSSIMRLSENSMDKLYDLMTMGCKYQYVTMRHPFELMELTLNHLDNIRASLTSDSENLKDIDVRMRSLHDVLTCGILADTRHALLNFFQGKRVKVSLFLQEGMQNPDATLNIPKDTSLPPLPTCEAPGTIRYYDQGACVLQETFAHPDSDLKVPSTVATYDPLNAATRQCVQGKNLYLMDRKKKNADGTTATSAATAPSAAPSSSKATPSSTSPVASGGVIPPPQRTTARPAGSFGALNSLSSLIVGANPAAATNSFKLNLFDDPNDDAPSSSPSAEAQIISISKMTREEVYSTNAELVSVIGTFQVQQPAAKQQAAGDDLLDLMDSA